MENPEIMPALLACPLFRDLNEKRLVQLIAAQPFQLKRYGSGELIARAGEVVHSLHIVISGSVKGEMIDFTGKVIKIEDMGPSRPLASAFLFGSQNRYPVNIIANEPVQIFSISRDSLLRIMQSDDLVLKNFLDAVSSRGQFLSNKIRFLSFSTIKGKLAHYLLELSGKQGGSAIILLPHSQSQLSELFGVARPSIGRAIGEMNRDGLIRTNGKQVILLDQIRLSALLK
jgi:CRP-like cAMP-binding protein